MPRRWSVAAVAATAFGACCPAARAPIEHASRPETIAVSNQTPPAHSSTPSERLAAFAERYWQWKLESSPELGTYVGDHRRDDRLDDVSDAARRRDAEAAARLREELHGIDPASLSGQDRISWDILDDRLAAAVEVAPLDFHLWQVDHMYGVHLSFASLVRVNHPRSNPHDLDNLLARYRAFPRQVDATIANLRLGLERGFVAPRESVRRVVRQLDEELAKPLMERSLAQQPATLADFLSPAEAEQRTGILNDVLEREISPALTRLRDMLRDEVLPRTREEVGIWTEPNGAEAYRWLIRYHTSTDRTPEEIHEAGLRELAAIEAEERTIAARLGHRGDLAAFSRRTRSDPRDHYRTREELLAAFQAIHDRAWAALPRAFAELPRIPSVVRPMEAFQERDSPPAFYNPPAEDGSRPGIFYANLSAPETRPRHNMEALTFHEDVPGHHLQMAFASGLHELPAFRRHVEFTVFVEGWALYAERLSDEMGLYTDDLSRYGMLGYQAWRACRLVVDTGMHAKHWTRQQAIAFMSEHTSLPPNEIENEVDRYVIWPGQALAYMIGALEIRRIRREAEQRLGDRFDLRAFHDVVLRSGAVPMSTLSRVVGEWTP